MKTMIHNFKTIDKIVKEFAINPTAQNFAKLTQEIIETEKELQTRLVHPTNTKYIEVYDFIKELLGEKRET